MRGMRNRLTFPLLVIAGCLFIAAPISAQSTQAHALPPKIELFGSSRSAFPLFWNAYRPVSLPRLDLNNGPRVYNLLRDGKLVLSLREFLQLVVENSLDLESARYNYLIANVDLLRAHSGQAARGTPEAPLPGALFAGAIGTGVGNNAGLAGGGTGGTAISASARQVVINARGTFDPAISINAKLGPRGESAELVEGGRYSHRFDSLF
jgi:hypothetical protein